MKQEQNDVSFGSFSKTDSDRVKSKIPRKLWISFTVADFIPGSLVLSEPACENS